MDIDTSFKQLVRPILAGVDAYNALPLPGHIGVKVAIDEQGHPAILIRDIPAFALSNFRLKYLELSLRRRCQVTADGLIRIEDFVLILLRTTDITLTHYFFSILETFLDTLNVLNDDTQREGAYHTLLEIFRSLNEEPLSTVQGLWSELFVICENGNISRLVNAWHQLPSDRFDFTSGNERLEVKSSKAMTRLHTFAAFQLIPEADTIITVASLYAIESSSGWSIQQLSNIIKDELKEPVLQLKLERIIAKTLGRGIDQSIKVQFDVQIARKSLCFFNAIDIPKIEITNIPVQVSDVHFKADLSEIRPIDPIKLFQGNLFRKP